jgi:AcrR family transcriptional regulator
MATKEKSARNQAWEKQREPSRGPKPGLSTIAIAREAIRIADAEGLDAVTMQRVARESCVTTMALYRYFPGKSDLVAVMIDSAGGCAPDLTLPSASWKEHLVEWARRCAAIYQKHPWFLEATTTRRSIMGPNELSWMEAALALLAEASLSPKESYYAFLAIMGHIRGYATFERLKGSSGSSQRWVRELSQLLLAESGRYPVLQAMLGSGALSEDPDQAFEYGLNRILDGISASKRKLGARTSALG